MNTFNRYLRAETVLSVGFGLPQVAFLIDNDCTFQSSNDQNDSGISAEGQSMTPGVSSERPVDVIATPTQKVTPIVSQS